MTRPKPKYAKSETVAIEKTPIDAAFLAFPKSVEQKERIGLLLATDGLPKEILTRYCQRTDAYAKAFHAKVGKNHIPASYRKGESLYMSQALKIIESALLKANDDSDENEFCWRLYAHSCAKYFQKKFPALGKLIAELYPKLEIESEASRFFESLCRSAFDNGLEEVAAIQELYDLMWVDRIQNFDSLLKLAIEPDPMAVLRKSFAKLSDQIAEAQSNMASLSNQHAELKNDYRELSDLQKKQLQNQESTVKDIIARISKIEQEVVGLEQNKTTDVAARQKLEVSFASARNAVDKLEVRIEKLVAKAELNTAIKSLESKLSELVELQSDVAKLRDDFITSTELVTGDLTELREAASQRPEITNASATAYRSPLFVGNTEPSVTYKILNERVFLESWLTCLARNYNIAISPEQLLAFHCVFATNKVVVTDRSLITSWLDCLGWKRFVKNVVASPLWSKEEDWKEGAEFVFEDRKDKQNPRILIIHNFDIGVVDCYLSPTLLLWSLKSQTNPLSKILLIPSESSIPMVTPSLMEQAASLDLREVTLDPKLRFDGNSWNIQLKRGELPIGVDPKLWSQWTTAQTKSIFDLKSVEKPLNVKFGDFAAANFRGTANFARKFFDEDSSVGVAMHHNILPWLMAKFPESEFDAKRRFLADLPNIVY